MTSQDRAELALPNYDHLPTDVLRRRVRTLTVERLLPSCAPEPSPGTSR